MYVRTTVAANLRSAPDTTKNNVITVLPAGTVVPADEASVAGWYAVLNLPAPAYLSHQVAEVYEVAPLPPGVIPYRSQEDADAKTRNNDCGEACVAMILQSKGVTVTIDSLKVNDATGESSPAELVALLDRYGVKSQIATFAADVMPPLGAICLIWDGAFDRAYVQQKNFAGQHFVVFLQDAGTPEPGILCHDPNFYADARQWGAYHRYMRSQWENAFTKCSPSRTGVILL